MALKFLDKKHFLYRNRGCVWSGRAHIAESGFFSTTLCGTSMLATNWVAIEGIQVLGCPECVKIYNEIKEKMNHEKQRK